MKIVLQDNINRTVQLCQGQKSIKSARLAVALGEPRLWRETSAKRVKSVKSVKSVEMVKDG